MLKDSSRRPVAFIVVVVALLGVFLLLPIVEGQICTQAHHQTNENCAPYEVVILFVVFLGHILREYEGAFTAASTIAIAVFTWRLWRSTDKLWEESRNASERQGAEMQRSLAIAKQSADATTEAAWAAEKTVKEMRANARHELRAYISISLRQEPSKHGPNREHGRFAQIIPILHNTGATPTRLLALAVECGWLNDELAASGHFFTPRAMKFDQHIAVQPRSTADGKLIEVQERQLWNPEERLHIWGIVKYQDVFLRHLNRTEFCFRVLPRPEGMGGLRLEFEPYGTHNRADEECDEA